MTDQAPERIWANAQEWPMGTGRIEVYAASKCDPDEPAHEYIRLDLHTTEVAKLRDERDEALTRETIAADAAVGYLERAEKAEAHITMLMDELAALREAVEALDDARQSLVDSSEEIAELRLTLSKTDLELPWLSDAIDKQTIALAKLRAHLEGEKE